MCLWLCGACRSENSLGADPEIRILMKVICWRDILGRRGDAGWGRISCGRWWVAARSQKLWGRTCSPACLCPAVMKRWLSSPAHPDLQGACLLPAQQSPYPWRRRQLKHVIGMGEWGLWGSGQCWELKFLFFLASKHLCHVPVTQSMIIGTSDKKPGLDKTGTA